MLPNSPNHNIQNHPLNCVYYFQTYQNPTQNEKLPYKCIQLYLQVFVKVRKYTNYLLLVDLSFDLNAYTGVELPMSS